MNEDANRRARGAEIWAEVTQMPPREPSGPFSAAVLDFVAAEVWARPALSVRDRRLISLSLAGVSGHAVPIRAHVRAALQSGDFTVEQLEEFVLHFAVYAGWPLASFVHATLSEVAADLDADAG